MIYQGYLFAHQGINRYKEKAESRMMENCYGNFYGLIFDCPVEEEVSSCVYKKLRLLSVKERINYYYALTVGEKMSLIEKHQRCLSSREKKSPYFTNHNNVE